MSRKDSLITKNLIDKINRTILRSIPFLPGPQLFDLFIELKEGKKSINSKIEEAYKSLNETSGLITELENDLKFRTEKVKELKETYEEYSKLAEIEEEKIQPLLKQLEKAVGKNRNVERLVSFFINLIAGLLIFVLGIWAGPKVKEWIWPKEKIETVKNSQDKTETRQSHIALFEKNEKQIKNKWNQLQ